MARIEPVEVEHKVGTCPACYGGLWCTLQVAVEVGTPLVSTEGRATVHASPRIEAMRIEHECSAVDPDEEARDE